jgi:hypothetical protein
MKIVSVKGMFLIARTIWDAETTTLVALVFSLLHVREHCRIASWFHAYFRIHRFIYGLIFYGLIFCRIRFENFHFPPPL